MHSKYWLALLLISSLQLWAKPTVTIVGKNRIDLGTFPASTEQKAVFTIKNSGTSPLKLGKIRKTCGCFIITTQKTTIESGETSTIEVKIKKGSIYHSFTKYLFVETNDEKQKIVRLKVTGNSQPLFEVLPKQKIYAGKIKGNDWSTSFQLTSKNKLATLGKPTSKTKIKLEIKLTPIKNKKATYKVQVKIPQQQKKYGYFREIITIPVITPKNQLPIKLTIYGELIKTENTKQKTENKK